jgi:hypothetical protein
MESYVQQVKELKPKKIQSLPHRLTMKQLFTGKNLLILLGIALALFIIVAGWNTDMF